MNIQASKQQFVSLLTDTIEAMIEEVQSHNFEQSPLTATELAGRYSTVSGIDKQTLQLVMSAVVEGSDEFHLARGRNGGFKPGPKPEPIPAAPKKLSEKAALKAQIEDLQRQLTAKEVNATPESDVLETLENA